MRLRLNVVQIAFASDDADDLDAIAQPSKEDYVVAATVTSACPVILGRPVLPRFRILRQCSTRRFASLCPAIRRLGFVSCDKFSVSCKSIDAIFGYLTFAITTAVL